MTELSPNVPVIVGVGQHLHRCGDAESATTPVDLMEAALRNAGDDAGCPTALAAAELVAVVGGLWSYADPGAILAERLGCTDASTQLTHFGGNLPQDLVNATAQAIVEGELQLALLVGGEARNSAAVLGKAGAKLDTSQPDAEPAEMFGRAMGRHDKTEIDRGLLTPIYAYPLFESAMRAARGESIDQNRTISAELYEGFSKVAQANPNAWRREPMSAAEIREPSPANRLVGYPYTRSMCANPKVDMGAGVIICSEAKAAELGIDPERFVYPLSASSGADTDIVATRSTFSESEPMRLVGQKALDLAGVTIDDVAHVDLYACFPSAVRMAATALDLDLDRQLTQTGGLHFGGGPMNNGVMHAIAQTVGAVRSDRGSVGLVHANGGFVTKQSIGLYGTDRPAQGFRFESVQDQLDARPEVVAAAPDASGTGVIDGVTVAFGRDGAERAILGVRLASGERAWANSTDPDLMAQIQDEELVGVSASVQGADVVVG